jgi:hypothetical protein
MKTVKLLLYVLVLAVVGCGGSSGGSSSRDDAVVDSLDSVDLNGSWEVMVETRSYNKTSRDYLYSNFNTERLILEDTPVGVRFRRCSEDFDVYSRFGVRSNGKLYLDLNEDGYTYLGNQRFERAGALEEVPWGPTNNLQQTVVTFTKLSENVENDAGTLEFSEPFAFSEDVRVCVQQNYANIGLEKRLNIEARYNDYSVLLSLRSASEWPIGTYSWERFSENNTGITDAYIDASYELLESTIGFSNTFARSGTITISEHSAAELSGSFELIDENDEVFRGSFSWDKNW